jgi:5-(carboxyamino)imidazole ribonucleotide mutase
MEDVMSDARLVLVGIIMGSRSDWATMEGAAKMLDDVGVGYEVEVVSAHRTPDRMMQYAEQAKGRGIRIIIAGAGGAAHLPGMVAAKTTLPVLGVPVKSSALQGMDSLLSIVQMPAGIPVATFAIGEAGAKNAGIFAAQILALGDEALEQRLEGFRKKQTETVMKGSDPRR